MIPQFDSSCPELSVIGSGFRFTFNGFDPTVKFIFSASGPMLGIQKFRPGTIEVKPLWFVEWFMDLYIKWLGLIEFRGACSLVQVQSPKLNSSSTVAQVYHIRRKLDVRRMVQIKRRNELRYEM